jgi:hypothetical protein
MRALSDPQLHRQEELRHLPPALKVVQRQAQEESNNNLFFFVPVALSTGDSRKP